MFDGFSRLDVFELKIWSSFLRISSGFERNKVFGVIRIVSLPITLFSAIIAGLLSGVLGGFDLKFFLINTFGLLLAHAASNVLNDFWDYKNKVDSPDYFRNVYGVHPVYALGERKALLLGLGLSFLAFLCGLYLFHQRGIWVLIFAFLGFIFLFSYSGPPFRFKYIGLGEFIVFLVWGPIMICGSFFVITGNFDFLVFLASLPYGFTASLVLFGKHLDKIKQDKEKGAKTLPVILGEDRTKKVCKILVLLPYLFVIVLAILTNRYLILLSFISFPRALSIFNGFDIPKPSRVEDAPSFYPREFWPMWYVGGAFIFNVDFALSYMISLSSILLLM